MLFFICWSFQDPVNGKESVFEFESKKKDWPISYSKLEILLFFYFSREVDWQNNQSSEEKSRTLLIWRKAICKYFLFFGLFQNYL